MRRSVVAALIASALVGAIAATADAHALLETSDPADGSTLNASPTAITVTFTEEPDPKFSSIRVMDAAGAKGYVGTLEARGRVLTMRTGELPRGVYLVSWRVLSRVDGHVSGGTFSFGVGVSPSTVDVPPSSAGSAPGPSAMSIAGRWVFYAGLMMLLGAGWLGAAALERAPVGLRWLGWSLAIAGATAIGEAQRRSASIPLDDVWSSSVGRAFAWRVIPLAAGGLVLMFVRGRLGGWLAAAAAAGSMLAHVAYGHAGAARIVPAAIAQQWVHFLGGGVWLGGLVTLLAGMRGLEPEPRARAVRVYSTVALWAVVAIAATGTMRAFTEVGSFSRLTSTSFGRLVLIKAVLLVTLVALGAVNRFRHVPRAAGSVGGLRRVARAEIAIAAGVLVSTGVLSGVAPARTIADTTRSNALVVTGSDFATTMRARLEMTPGGPGPNAFALRLTDYDTGSAIEATVRLTFRSRLRQDLEPSRVDLERGADGVYRGTAPNLAFGGPWSVEVLAQRASTSTTVPLIVFPRVTQRISEASSPGSPTLYTVALEGGRSVQFYVDPGRNGRNEVHATFLRAGGTRALDVDEAVMVATLQDGETFGLSVRELTPGHMVGGATLQAGRWRFDVAASDGSVPLTAFFEQDIGS